MRSVLASSIYFPEILISFCPIYNTVSEIVHSKFYTSMKFHGERLIGGHSFQYIPLGRSRQIFYCNISANSDYSAFSSIQVSWVCSYLLFLPCNLSDKLYPWYFSSLTPKFNHRKLTAFQEGSGKKAQHGEQPLPEIWDSFPVLVWEWWKSVLWVLM